MIQKTISILTSLPLKLRLQRNKKRQMKRGPKISQQLRFRPHSWIPEAPEVLTPPQKPCWPECNSRQPLSEAAALQTQEWSGRLSASGSVQTANPQKLLSFRKTESGPPTAGTPRVQLAFLVSPECTHDPFSLKTIEWFSHGHGFLPELSWLPATNPIFSHKQAPRQYPHP